MFGRIPASTGFAAILAGLCATGCLSVSHAAEDPPPVVQAGLSEPVKAWKAAMEAGNLAALARMHDAATFGFPPGAMVVKGTDIIMKGYAETFAAYTARVSFDDTHYVAQPTLVVSWGLFKLILHPKAGGADIVTRGRFTDAAVRVAGGWRYVVDHASVPARGGAGK